MPPKTKNANEKRLKLVNQSADLLISKVPDAIETILSIMADTTISAAIRLQACQTLLNYAKVERQRALDLHDKQTEQEAAERWDLSPLEKLARRMEA